MDGTNGGLGLMGEMGPMGLMGLIGGEGLDLPAVEGRGGKEFVNQDIFVGAMGAGGVARTDLQGGEVVHERHVARGGGDEGREP